MPIQNISPIISQLKMRVQNEGLDNPVPLTEESGASGESSFSDMITEAIESVDASQKIADQNVQDIITGQSDDIHEVMISMEKAQLSFQLMVEMRNKVVETYQELSRMQI